MSASSKPRGFDVASGSGTYQVMVSQGTFADTMRRVTRGTIIADAFFRPVFLQSTARPLLLEATEHAKSLDQIAPLIEQLRAQGATRSTEVVAIGGGVIQDISAFVTSIYMRGIRWIYYPTTVLAMVDSCIGGKSSINVGPYKNLVGTFHPPDPILIDPVLAETLPRDQFASGLIEAAKICFCRGPEAFAAYLAQAPSTTMSTDALESVILESLHAKKHFIELDEFDKKERLLLNFGHTFGHALEGASHYRIPHGIAVGLGILCSLAFQRSRGVRYAGAPTVAEFEQHLDAMIRKLPDLRKQLAAIDLDDVLDRFASDKKHTAQRFTLIVVTSRGNVVLEHLERSPGLQLQLREAIHLTIESYMQ